MKTISKLFVLLFILSAAASCRTSIPLERKRSENNSTYEISYLFEHDGCRVYRFYDQGHYVYFTTRGDVTSIKNDSTSERVITIIKEPVMPIKKKAIH